MLDTREVAHRGSAVGPVASYFCTLAVLTISDNAPESDRRSTTRHLRQRRDVADMLHGALVPFANQIVTTSITVQPAVAHYLGRLDHLAQRYDDAETWFAQALRIAEGMESPLLMAYTHATWAELAADRGDAARARELADGALAPAVEGGYGYIERDALAVLDRLG